MKLLLDMYKSAPKEQRDKVQLMAAERKSKAEVRSSAVQPAWFPHFMSELVLPWFAESVNQRDKTCSHRRGFPQDNPQPAAELKPELVFVRHTLRGQQTRLHIQ